ncbi:uncharacterized protein LOC141561445 isoform X2 [Sminthopsis crassicaudata]
MVHLHHHTRTKLSTLPDHSPTPLPLALCLKHRVTATKTPLSSTGTVTPPLPKIEHPRTIAQPCKSQKHNSRVRILPSFYPEHRAKVTPNDWVTSTSPLCSQSKVMVKSSSCPKILARATAASAVNHKPWAKATVHLKPHPIHSDNNISLPFLYSDQRSGSSPHPNHQTVSLPYVSNRAKFSKGLSHQASNSLVFAHWRKELPRINCQATPLQISDPQAEASGCPTHQDESVPGYNCQTPSLPSLNHPITIPSILDHQTKFSLGLVHPTTLRPGQDNWTYVPLDPDHQYTTPQGLNYWTEANLNHCAKDMTQKVIPNLEVTLDTSPNAMSPSGWECLAIPSAGLGCQNPTDRNYCRQAEEAILDSNVQGASLLVPCPEEIILLEPGHQATHYSGTDYWAEATANSNAPITLTSVVCHQESRTLRPKNQSKYSEEWEKCTTLPMGHDLQTEKDVLGLNGQGASSVVLDLKKTMSLGSDHKVTHYIGTDCQAQAVADLHTQPIVLHPLELRTLGSDFQTKYLEEQENQAAPQISPNPQAEEIVPDPNTQKTSPSVPVIEKTMPLVSGPQASLQNRPGQQVQPAEGPNITHSMSVTGLELGIEPPQCPGSWAMFLPTHISKVKSPTSCDTSTKVKMNCNNQAEAQSRFQDQLQNRDALCSNSIEPFIIERGIVPTRIINAIISSISLGKIKIDIYKQIILQQQSQGPNNWPNQLISSNYKVCLICASWIPNGCPHVQQMEHLSQAQLLAIPTPFPGCEEVGIKLVLRMPQKRKACSSLSFPYNHFGKLRPSHHLILSSHSDSKSSIHQQLPTKVPQPGYMLGNDHQPHRQNISGRLQSFKGELHMRDDDSKKEKSKIHGNFSKFILGRFQKRKK